MNSLIEKIDLLKLKTIVCNIEKLKEKVGVAYDCRKCVRVDFSQTKTILTKYLKSKGKTGENVINYGFSSKATDGRLFSKTCSLQGIPRTVRHTICKDIYWDLDIKNCHPVIFKWYCDTNKIECKNLTYYINNRDICLKELLDLYPTLTKDEVKSSVLSIMNGGGGHETIYKSNCIPSWYSLFKKEVSKCHKAITILFPKYLKAIKRQKGDDVYNLNGKVCNKMFCLYEGIILNHMRDFINSSGLTIGALCFDGLMVYKKDNFDLISCLSNMEKYVLDKMNISVTILEKIMDEDIDLSGLDCNLEITKIEEQIVVYDDEFVLTVEEIDNYVWTDFYMESRKVFEDKNKLFNFFRTRFPYVCHKINKGKGLYVKKETIDNVNNLVDGKYSENFTYINPAVPCGFSFPTMKDLIEQTGISTYSELCYKPKNDILKYQFNTWTNIKADTKNKVKGDVSILLKFIEEIICNNDNSLYKYIISWLRQICITPWNKTKTVLLFHSKQGTGKGTFVNWLIKDLFGIKNSAYSSITAITQKHNEILANKIFMGIDELPTVEKQFHNLFDTLKGIITDPFCSIEPKGLERYSIDNLCNFIFMTNNKNSIKLELSDRRYVVFEINENKIGDFGYWDNMHKNVFTEEMGQYFFTYLTNILDDDKIVVDLRKIPSSDLREEMKDMSMTNIQAFIRDVKQRNNLEGISFTLYGSEEVKDAYGNMGYMKTDICRDPKYKKGIEILIKKQDLYKAYCLWCFNMGEKVSKMKMLNNELKEIKKNDARCFLL